MPAQSWPRGRASTWTTGPARPAQSDLAERDARGLPAVLAGGFCSPPLRAGVPGAVAEGFVAPVVRGVLFAGLVVPGADFDGDSPAAAA